MSTTFLQYVDRIVYEDRIRRLEKADEAFKIAKDIHRNAVDNAEEEMDQRRNLGIYLNQVVEQHPDIASLVTMPDSEEVYYRRLFKILDDACVILGKAYEGTVRPNLKLNINIDNEPVVKKLIEIGLLRKSDDNYAPSNQGMDIVNRYYQIKYGSTLQELLQKM